MHLRIVISLIFFALFLTSIYLIKNLNGKSKGGEPLSVSKTYKVSVVFSMVIFAFMFFSNVFLLLNDFFR